jgi:hypothetical protein
LQNASEVQRAELASDYLSLFGYVALAREWTDMGIAAYANREENPDFYDDKIATATFYMSRILPQHLGHLEIIKTYKNE